MAFDTNKSLAAGTKVRVVEPMDVPEWSKWDDDAGRISSSVKRRLQQMFFRGNKNLSAEIVYIASEEERERLRRKGRIKVRVRDQERLRNHAHRRSDDAHQGPLKRADAEPFDEEPKESPLRWDLHMLQFVRAFMIVRSTPGEPDG